LIDRARGKPGLAGSLQDRAAPPEDPPEAQARRQKHRLLFQQRSAIGIVIHAPVQPFRAPRGSGAQAGGFAGAALSGQAWIGVVAAMAASTFLAGLFAWTVVYLRTDQIVTGMAINMIAVGGSGTAWLMLQAHGYVDLPSSAGFTRGVVPWLTMDMQRWLGDLPLVGPIFFHQYGLAPIAALLAVSGWWVLGYTRVGVILTALGNNPDACAKMGIAVRRWRCVIILLAGCLAGLAGAYLSIMRVHGFTALMTGGMGFVILALVIFSRWRIAFLLVVCCCFGLVDALQSVLQGSGMNDVVPYQVFQALPFLVALVAMCCLQRAARGPATLGQAWPAEQTRT
jgi:simple sugar transport system permease protein